MIGGFIVTEMIRSGWSSVVSGLRWRTRESRSLLPDPVLRLFGSNGSQFAVNDNCGRYQATDLQATGLAPLHSFESAILATLAPGAYTAIVSGKNGATGIGLVEVYDVNQTSNSKLANISTRGVVKTGDNVMIGSFILGGSSAMPGRVGRSRDRAFARASGVAGSLADPQLTLVNSNGRGARRMLTITGRITLRRRPNCRHWVCFRKISAE